VSFYSSFLKSANLIFDIGAYDGHKTAAFLSLSKKIVCCEPDEENARLLRIRFRRQHARVFVEQVAIAENTGTRSYYIHHPGSAFNTISARWKNILEADDGKKWNENIHFTDKRDILCSTLDLMIAKWGQPDFIKIDVEGAELSVFKGLSVAVKAVSFESLWPEYREQMWECMQILARLDNNYRFNIAVDEKLVMPEFVTASSIVEFLQEKPLTHIEIIARK
jgi:FkbM family methyltransferase